MELRLFLTVVIFLIALNAKSQSGNTDSTGNFIEIIDSKTGKVSKVKVVGTPGDTTKLTINVDPEYPGGLPRFINFLKAKVVYPVEAKKNRIKGDVKASFVIDTDGSVTDVKVIKEIGGGCDEELVRVVASSRKWNPAIKNNKYVPFYQEVVFTFK